jgi:hypothetical protein
MPHFECGAIDHSATSPEPNAAQNSAVYLSKACNPNKGGLAPALSGAAQARFPHDNAPAGDFGPLLAYCEPASPALRITGAQRAVSDFT